MLKLYFGTLTAAISTLLAVAFAVFFAVVMSRRSSITHWGLLTLAMFVLGLAMSMMSGMKDGMGTAASVLPMKHWVTIALSVVGGLGMLTGVLALFIRNQGFWQAGFYALSAVIILKLVMTEAFRVVLYLRG
ncbi:MAG TPA: hypothetical protein VLA21_02345 [Candidatus Limnocylindria bacterium]|nr:hypothetical protein [Candidatus Limnocylindria bacterium]